LVGRTESATVVVAARSGLVQGENPAVCAEQPSKTAFHTYVDEKTKEL
jgi:hypothetical protein